MRGPRAEARVGAVDEASTAAREGACAPRDQRRQKGIHVRIRFCKAPARRFGNLYGRLGSLRYDVGRAGVRTGLVARFQRLIAIMASNPGRCPGLSGCRLSGLVFVPPFWKENAMNLSLTERLSFCFAEQHPPEQWTEEHKSTPNFK